VVVAEVTTPAQEAQEELVAVAWEAHLTVLLVSMVLLILVAEVAVRLLAALALS
jgi:hypothetical protein